MNQEVMIWIIVVAFCSTHIHGLSKCSCCRGAPRGFKSSKVLDMDFLMDFHYPKALEQPDETVAKAYPLSGNFDHLVKSFRSNPIQRIDTSNGNPIVWEHRGILTPEMRIGPPLTKHQSEIGKFFRTGADGIKRDFSTKINFRKTNCQANAMKTLVHSDHLSYPRIRRSSMRKRQDRAKRFFVSRGINHRAKARRFKVDPFGNFSWTPWHVNGHLVNMTKRDTSNRRMKLSDILTRAGLRKDKEEAIKVVLPLLLSDLKETPSKNTVPLLAANMELHSPIISSSSGKHMRNFKVKGDDGKEFSFSASSSDVQQLMEILAKPNSSVVLERVSLDKNRSLLKTHTERTKPPGRKKTPSSHKAKEAVIPSDNVNNTEALQLKEFESSVFESIVQLDVPSRQLKCTTPRPDPTNEETTASDTTGS